MCIGMMELQKQSFRGVLQLYYKTPRTPKNTYFYRTPPVAASGINKTYQHLNGSARFSISHTRLGKKQAKYNTLRLNFCFLKIICFLHRCYY